MKKLCTMEVLDLLESWSTAPGDDLSVEGFVKWLSEECEYHMPDASYFLTVEDAFKYFVANYVG
jgi:hypothetical protein